MKSYIVFIYRLSMSLQQMGNEHKFLLRIIIFGKKTTNAYQWMKRKKPPYVLLSGLESRFTFTGLTVPVFFKFFNIPHHTPFSNFIFVLL